jgi:hypothetical protein
MADEKLKSLYEELLKLSDDERLELFNKFCKKCGDIDPRCKCWNDD